MAKPKTGRTIRSRRLRDGQRAELFQSLARTLSAGLSAAQALDAMRGICDGVIDPALQRAGKSVSGGTALLRSLERNGLISPHEYPMLSVAETNGALEEACEQLAQRYRRSEARWRQLKGKLLMPAVVLVIAIIVLPLPALVGGKLSINDYVLGAVSMLILLAMIVQLIVMLLSNWRSHGTPGWLTRIARLLPILGPMSALHQRADATERLSLALRFGSPADDTLKMMVRTENNSVRKHAFTSMRKDLSAGATLATALQRRDLLDASQFAIVSSGEAAGRVDDSLDRVATDCHDTLDGRYGVIAQWLPVFVYACVAGSIMVGLLG